MISFNRLNEKSLLLLALVLMWSTAAPYPLVIASPLLKTSSFTSSLSMANPPIESKAGGGTASPADYVVVEEDTPISLDTLNKLVSNQPQLRMLRPSSFDAHDAEEAQIGGIFARKNDQPNEDNNLRLSRLLEQYFRSSNNRLPRRLGATSKRAAAMGVDLPDYILHINKGRNFDFSSFREKMQKSG